MTASLGQTFMLEELKKIKIACFPYKILVSPLTHMTNQYSSVLFQLFLALIPSDSLGSTRDSPLILNSCILLAFLVLKFKVVSNGYCPQLFEVAHIQSRL